MILETDAYILESVNNLFRAHRTSPRTPGCTTHEHEKLPLPASSNFLSHLKSCKRLPKHVSYDSWLSAKTARAAGEGISAATPLSGLSAQRSIMSDFIARGVANPEKPSVSKKGFREHFVKGIVEDDLPFNFGEKGGMEKCFLYVLPEGYKVPSRSTVGRDVNLLFEGLDGVLNNALKVRFCYTVSGYSIYLLFYTGAEIKAFNCQRRVDRKKLCLCICWCGRVLDQR